jgi:hypothetical protein
VAGCSDRAMVVSVAWADVPCSRSICDGCYIRPSTRSSRYKRSPRRGKGRGTKSRAKEMRAGCLGHARTMLELCCAPPCSIQCRLVSHKTVVRVLSSSAAAERGEGARAALSGPSSQLPHCYGRLGGRHDSAVACDIRAARPRCGRAARRQARERTRGDGTAGGLRQ